MMLQSAKSGERAREQSLVNAGSQSVDRGKRQTQKEKERRLKKGVKRWIDSHICKRVQRPAAAASAAAVVTSKCEHCLS